MTVGVRFERWVPAPLAEVFAFFSDPANLPRIMPPGLEARLVGLKIVPPEGAPSRPEDRAPPAGVGSEIAVSVRPFPFLPLRTLWVARITGFEMNRYFSDVQAKGPFHLWKHRHDFEVATRNGREGTIVRDLVEYGVGFGLAGRLLESLLVAGQVRRIFAHRYRMLETLLARR